MIEVYIGDKENWAYVEAGSAWCQVAMGECAIGMWTNKEGKPMSEKKDCVERGKRALNQLAIDLQFADNEVKTKAQIVAVCKAGIEALTALEGRVRELEIDLMACEDTISEVYGGTINKEARDD